MVVNRFHHDTAGVPHAGRLRGQLRRLLGPEGDLPERLVANLEDYRVLAERDAATVTRIRAELGDPPLLLVPHLDDDVHDVDGLLAMHRYLFASEAERERLISALVA